MRKLILITHTSLDGFVAGINGELTGFEMRDDNLEFVCRLTDDADAALFGRVSYKLLNDYWPEIKNSPDATKTEIHFSTWYNSAEKIIFSTTLKEEGLANTTIINSNLPDEIIKIKQQPGKSILIFGSPAISQILMRLDVIDSYWIFINPVIFGEGIPLFSGSTKPKKLTLISTKQFANGEIALNYI